MNNIFMAVIHYDGEIVKTDIGVVFDSENTTKMRFSKSISLRELKRDIEEKIGVDIVRLRYRWKTCDDPVRYYAITLKDDNDVGIMIAEHDSTSIRSVALHAELRGRYDVPSLSRNVYGSSSQMGFDSAAEDYPYRFGDSFVAMLESGRSSAFDPYACPSTFSTVESVIDPKTLADYSEYEETADPDLSGDDLGDDPIVGGGKFVSGGDGITWYEPPAHMNLIDYDMMRAPEYPVMPQICSSSSDGLSVRMQFADKEEATLAIKEYSIRKHVDYIVKESSSRTLFAKCVKYGEDCTWKIRVSKLQRRNCWEITKASIKQQFEYQIEYGKGWYARDKALKKVYGNYEKSYNELPPLLNAMVLFVPGTIVRKQWMDTSACLSRVLCTPYWQECN
ncbi:hypothetical protein GQ457_03G032070 [Hibiscus cannabinus]